MADTAGVDKECPIEVSMRVDDERLRMRSGRLG
jgi:hypothetical protein